MEGRLPSGMSTLSNSCVSLGESQPFWAQFLLWLKIIAACRVTVGVNKQGARACRVLLHSHSSIHFFTYIHTLVHFHFHIHTLTSLGLSFLTCQAETLTVPLRMVSGKHPTHGTALGNLSYYSFFLSPHVTEDSIKGRP